MTIYRVTAPTIQARNNSGDLRQLGHYAQLDSADYPSGVLTALVTAGLIEVYAPPDSGHQERGEGALPAPASGDAGKVVTVNDAEDGYELGTVSGGVALPVGTAGLHDGLIGLEYNGNPAAVNLPLAFDTLYTDPTTGVSTPTDPDNPIETDDYTFSLDSITPKSNGLYAVEFSVELDAPLTAPCAVTLTGTIGIPTTLTTAPSDASPDKIRFSLVIAARAGSALFFTIGADAADSGVNITYAHFGVAKLA